MEDVVSSLARLVLKGAKSSPTCFACKTPQK